MRINGKIPGADVTVLCTMENGKALLEWETDWEGRMDIFLKDARGNVVLECHKMWGEDEPLRAVLLKPVLWTGVENPYLYTLEIIFMDRQGRVMDTVTVPFPLRSLTRQVNPVTEEENILLNGEKFVSKAVRYRVDDGSESVGTSSKKQTVVGLQQRIMEDMRLLADMGANSICFEDEECPPPLLRLCDRIGLLAAGVRETGMWVSGQVPLFCGGENALLTSDRKATENYYRYKARWSSTPFVHLSSESLKRQENGNYKIICYSNCKKVALYVDGKFFEMQRGQEIFTFEEIPVKCPGIVFSAEGEGCSMSLSLHRTFTMLSRIGDN